jgi:hypothetical protein
VILKIHGRGEKDGRENDLAKIAKIVEITISSIIGSGPRPGRSSALEIQQESLKRAVLEKVHPARSAVMARSAMFMAPQGQ